MSGGSRVCDGIPLNQTPGNPPPDPVLFAYLQSSPPPSRSAVTNFKMVPPKKFTPSKLQSLSHSIPLIPSYRHPSNLSNKILGHGIQCLELLKPERRSGHAWTIGGKKDWVMIEAILDRCWTWYLGKRWSQSMVASTLSVLFQILATSSQLLHQVNLVLE